MKEEFPKSPKLQYVSPTEIARLKGNIIDPNSLVETLADIFRVNTLSSIMEAGSGHIGSSFSSIDIVTSLWIQRLRNPNSPKDNPSDIYFSSKGHDVPALYSVMSGLGYLDFDLIHKLRKIDGLPGHPDVHTPLIATNTGALGMGISKARGMAKANRLSGIKGNIYVLTGDGELQEGQFWESLQPTANGKYSEITVIVDHNKIQSDIWVEKTSSLGDLEAKLAAFGWEVSRCDGHDFKAINETLNHFDKIKDKPKILIADTIKGKGVSFMEGTAFNPKALALSTNPDQIYKFHSGAPNLDQYLSGLKEIIERINKRLKKLNQKPLKLEEFDMPIRNAASQTSQKLVSAYGDELLKIARKNKKIVAMDGDLVLDTGLIPFKNELPDRYIQNGIAEADMVSMAGGLALKGIIPVVHSFECFLSTQANAQIYNNSTEGKKIIYTGSLAGIVPGGPGHSHQSVRGISALGDNPNLILIEPSNEAETRMAINWAVNKNTNSTYLRLVSIPVETPFKLPPNYKLKEGQGVQVKQGEDAVIFSYGPVMLTEAFNASVSLEKQGISLAIINLPWLNRTDPNWLKKALKPFDKIFTLDDHYLRFGQGTMLSAAITRGINKKVELISFGVEEIPACGTNQEVLKHHGLDAESLAKRIKKAFLNY